MLELLGIIFLVILGIICFAVLGILIKIFGAIFSFAFGCIDEGCGCIVFLVVMIFCFVALIANI